MTAMGPMPFGSPVGGAVPNNSVDRQSRKPFVLRMEPRATAAPVWSRTVGPSCHFLGSCTWSYVNSSRLSVAKMTLATNLTDEAN